MTDTPDEDLPVSMPGSEGDDLPVSMPTAPSRNQEGQEFFPVVPGYRVVREIGRGGMGAVYEAEQSVPRRKVALKVIRPGSIDPGILKRFKREIQALGSLEHPAIARLYEAGTTKEDQPFFAMEYVDGMPLTKYAEQHTLGIKERLAIMVKVIDGIHHAHSKGIIHRDLKPDNILVNKEGQPKILDFGVAKITDSDIQLTTMQTNIGVLLGTLAYMSPEQASGKTTELDFRSDVYALGVIGYELLTGQLPYTFKQKLIHEAARIIREEEPTRLSSYNRTLRGDLDTIVGKALEKEKTRRYQTARDLAEDLQRYLSNEPITARRPSVFYRFRKYSLRHKAVLWSMAAVLVALSLGIAGTMYRQSRRQQEALEKEAFRRQAQEAAARAEADDLFYTALSDASNNVPSQAFEHVAEAMDIQQPWEYGLLMTKITAEARSRWVLAGKVETADKPEWVRMLGNDHVLSMHRGTISRFSLSGPEKPVRLSFNAPGVFPMLGKQLVLVNPAGKLTSYRTHDLSMEDAVAFESPIIDAALSGEGTRCAVLLASGAVTVFQLPGLIAEAEHTFHFETAGRVQKHNRLAFSPSGKRLAVHAGFSRLAHSWWDLEQNVVSEFELPADRFVFIDDEQVLGLEARENMPWKMRVYPSPKDPLPYFYTAKDQNPGDPDTFRVWRSEDTGTRKVLNPLDTKVAEATSLTSNRLVRLALNKPALELDGDPINSLMPGSGSETEALWYDGHTQQLLSWHDGRICVFQYRPGYLLPGAQLELGDRLWTLQGDHIFVEQAGALVGYSFSGEKRLKYTLIRPPWLGPANIKVLAFSFGRREGEVQVVWGIPAHRSREQKPTHLTRYLVSSTEAVEMMDHTELDVPKGTECYLAQGRDRLLLVTNEEASRYMLIDTSSGALAASGENESRVAFAAFHDEEVLLSLENGTVDRWLPGRTNAVTASTTWPLAVNDEEGRAVAYDPAAGRLVITDAETFTPIMELDTVPGPCPVIFPKGTRGLAYSSGDKINLVFPMQRKEADAYLEQVTR